MSKENDSTGRRKHGMSIDEIIDWLEALHCQHGSLHVTLDGKTMQVGEIASNAAMEIDHMREIVAYLDNE